MSQLRSQYITFTNNPRDLGRTGAMRNGLAHGLSCDRPMEQYHLCGLSSSPGCGFRSIAVRQRPAPLEIKGSALMHKVVFAAALAVGLITAPMSQFVSSAAAQQASAEKNAKMK